MTIERYLRLIAGVVVLASLALSRLHSEYWLILTAVMGLNLIQSAATNWCPMTPVLRLLGVKDCSQHGAA